jgi:hypothetical protein
MMGAGGDGGSVAAPFRYQPFALSVPSQSRVDHGHGGNDYYGMRQRSHSLSQATPTSYSRSPVAPSPSASHQHHHLQYPSPTVPGHFSSPFAGGNIPNQAHHQSRVPQIHLGGLVVKDQSSSQMLRNDYSLNNPASSLSTLASVANSSGRPLGLQPMQSDQSNEPQPSSLTLPPIGAVRRDVEPGALSIAVPTADAGVIPLPFLAPPRLPIGDKAARESELRRVLHGSLPRREICDRLIEYYVSYFFPIQTSFLTTSISV